MMSFTMDSVSVINPKLTHTRVSVPFNKLPHCVKFHPLLKHRSFTLSVNAVTPNACFLRLNRRNPLTVAFTASPRDSEHGEVEVEKENDDEAPNVGSEESEEAWKQALDTFKEQALKLQGVSQEAYEVYSKKAIIILKDTTEQLKVQADKARHDLSVAAKGITEEGKEYLSTAAENSPEVKEIVETFTSPTDELNKISGVRDFYVGVPYGYCLEVGDLQNKGTRGYIIPSYLRGQVPIYRLRRIDDLVIFTCREVLAPNEDNDWYLMRVSLYRTCIYPDKDCY